MKTYRFLLVLGGLLFVGYASLAQTQKIGYADWEYIFSQMPEYKQVTTQLETHNQQLTKQYEAKAQEFQTKLNNYQQNGATMVDAVRRSTETELGRLQQELQEFEADAQNSIVEKQNQLMQPVFTKVGNAINAVAKENEYTFILSPATLQGADIILYADEQYDISDLVLQKMGITPTALPAAAGN